MEFDANDLKRSLRVYLIMLFPMGIHVNLNLHGRFIPACASLILACCKPHLLTCRGFGHPCGLTGMDPGAWLHVLTCWRPGRATPRATHSGQPRLTSPGTTAVAWEGPGAASLTSASDFT